MLFYVISAFCVAAFGLSATGEYTLPATICKQNSTDYSACLIRSIKEAWPRFVAGIPEFDFPPLDPLFFKYEKFVFNLNEIRAKEILSNVSIIGLSKARFLDVRTHFLDDVFRLEVDVQVPKLYAEGGLNVNGTLNVFGMVEINGNGHFNLSTDDVRATINITGHVVNDIGIVEHVRVTPSLGNFKIYFNNLSEQSKEISDIGVAFVNEYWPALFRLMLPLVSNVLDPWLSKFPNRILSKIPFSKIFP